MTLTILKCYRLMFAQIFQRQENNQLFVEKYKFLKRNLRKNITEFCKETKITESDKIR